MEINRHKFHRYFMYFRVPGENDHWDCNVNIRDPKSPGAKYFLTEGWANHVPKVFFNFASFPPGYLLRWSFDVTTPGFQNRETQYFLDNSIVVDKNRWSKYILGKAREYFSYPPKNRNDVQGIF